MQWENTTNETVLQRRGTRSGESWRRTCAENADHPRAKELFDRNKLPAFHDPFAGGGALPLEAQRLGLESLRQRPQPGGGADQQGDDRDPAEVRGQAAGEPGGAQGRRTLIAREWKGAQGLAEDVRYYGKWMRDEAEKRIGHLYPKVEVTAEMAKERPDLKPYVGRKLTVIAWLWARTVKSPNPAFAQVDVPLASTFMLSTKAGKEAYVEPVIEDGGYRFTVKVGKPKDAEAAKSGTKLSRGANFQCLMSGTPIAGDYIKAEGKAGRMGARLMAIVAEGDAGGSISRRRRSTRPRRARRSRSGSRTSTMLTAAAQYLGVKPYGLTTVRRPLHPPPARGADDLLRPGAGSARAGAARRPRRRPARRRQAPARRRHRRRPPTPRRWRCTWRSLSSKAADYEYVALHMEQLHETQSSSTFGRQAIPMTWDYAESKSVLRSSAETSTERCDRHAKALRALPQACRHGVCACRRDATGQIASREQGRLHRSALLRQHRLRRPIGLLLRLAAPLAAASLPRPLRHSRRAQGRGTGRNALPPRQQGEGRGLLPRRHDAGDAPPRRAGAPGLPGHHLLRLQAGRER